MVRWAVATTTSQWSARDHGCLPVELDGLIGEPDDCISVIGKHRSFDSRDSRGGRVDRVYRLERNLVKLAPPVSRNLDAAIG